MRRLGLDMAGGWLGVFAGVVVGSCALRALAGWGSRGGGGGGGGGARGGEGGGTWAAAGQSIAKRGGVLAGCRAGLL